MRDAASWAIMVSMGIAGGKSFVEGARVRIISTDETGVIESVGNVLSQVVTDDGRLRACTRGDMELID